MSTSATAASPRPRGLQFTLAALLATMTAVALICVALARPTRFWSEAMVLLVLAALLTSIPAIVYRSGRMRAFAVGFLVFTLGFLAALISRERLFRDPRFGSGNDEFVSSHLGTWLFTKIHPNNYQPVAGMPGMAMGGGFGGGGMGGGGMGGGGMGGGGMGGGMMPGSGTMPMMSPKYDPDRFMEIVHAACALLAGIVGGMVTQILYATRPRPGDQRDRATF